jgi:transcriptional regulator with XRE-family HTH domain
MNRLVPPPGPIDAHVGSRIRLRRFALGISQKALGTALGVTFQQVQKYEKGENRVGAARLPALAAALKTQVGHFFEGIEDAAAAASPPSGIDAFLASREGPALALAFMQIKNPRLRTALLSHVRALAVAEEAAIVAGLESAARANAEAANTMPVTAAQADAMTRNAT